MIRRKISLLFIAGITFLLLSFVACDDIFETDIRDKQVTLLAPGDSIIFLADTLTAAGLEVNFSWEPVNGASHYRLQVVSGSFDNAIDLSEDTLVTKQNFKLSFPEGKYSWRVRGENSAYQSGYSFRNFEIGIK